MNKNIRPLGMLLAHLFQRNTKIWEKPFGKIVNKEMADESVDTYLKIIQAIQKGESFFDYQSISFTLPTTIPGDILTVLPYYLPEDERKVFFEQEKTNNYQVRGVNFQYQKTKLTEQEKLEVEIELYITGGRFLKIPEKSRLEKVTAMVDQHSRGDQTEDLEFAVDLITSDFAREKIFGKERLEHLLIVAQELGYTKTINDPEIKPKYDKLMEIYGSQLVAK
jgi:hypothetical protein